MHPSLRKELNRIISDWNALGRTLSRTCSSSAHVDRSIAAGPSRYMSHHVIRWWCDGGLAMSPFGGKADVTLTCSHVAFW